VRGTRISVGLVLEELAQNPDISELLAAHPDLTRADVQACLGLGAEPIVLVRSAFSPLSIRYLTKDLHFAQ